MSSRHLFVLACLASLLTTASAHAFTLQGRVTLDIDTRYGTHTIGWRDGAVRVAVYDCWVEDCSVYTPFPASYAAQTSNGGWFSIEDDRSLLGIYKVKVNIYSDAQEISESFDDDVYVENEDGEYYYWTTYRNK
ncbi:MAG: hypothetical protein HYV63_26690 [Candidatus Schekmanbacteria bacterium]|nr:hypothetical protein [Candidatus Schekmanbacteria bacterium]